MLVKSDLPSQHTQSSVPNPFSPQLCIHPVPSWWKTRDYNLYTREEIENVLNFIILVCLT